MAPVEVQSVSPPRRRWFAYALLALAACALGRFVAIERPVQPAKTSRVRAAKPAALPQPLMAEGDAGLRSVRLDGVAASDAPAPESSVVDAEGNESLAEAQALLADAGASVTGSPTGAVISERAAAKIRSAAELAQRGAQFAARNELLAVLQMIAEAKDQIHGRPRRTVALAAGLRALEEAEDFSRRSADVDSQAGLERLVESHRTPVGRSAAAKGLMAPELANLYFRYAQLQLGAAVVDEPAGSMALHSLGKLYSQFAQLEPETFPEADRRAFAMQQAALLARPDNYLAAHELGVLLAESGHFSEAEQTLVQVAAQQPHPTIFRNLARVQRKLGQENYAVANEQHAQMLAVRTPPTNGNVAWTARDEFIAAGDALGPANQPGGAPQQAPVQTATRPAPYGWAR